MDGLAKMLGRRALTRQQTEGMLDHVQSKSIPVDNMPALDPRRRRAPSRPDAPPGASPRAGALRSRLRRSTGGEGEDEGAVVSSLWEQNVDPLSKSDVYRRDAKHEMIVNQLERLSSSFSHNKGTYDGMSRAPDDKAGFTSLADAVWSKQLVDDDQMLRNVENWSRKARQLVNVRAEESRLMDQHEIQEIHMFSEELRTDQYRNNLRFDCINAAIHVTGRKRLKKVERAQTIRSERRIMETAETKQKQLTDLLWERRRRRERELHEVFTEGPRMVAQFGELLANSSRDMVRILEPHLVRLREEGMLLGRVVGTSNELSTIQTVIRLNPIDMSACLRLVNDGLTIVHTEY